jgi:5'-deoxynucleotidase YfbR-like HD superfamily hydrolase
MIIAIEIADRIHQIYTSMHIDMDKLARMAAYHDVEEGMTGDIPTPFKRQATNVIWPDQKYKEDGIEGAIVSVADTVEALTFLKRYGVIKEGRVMDGMWPNLKENKEKLFIKAIETYNHHMPGIEQEPLVKNLSTKIGDIIDDIVRTVAYYE